MCRLTRVFCGAGVIALVLLSACASPGPASPSPKPACSVPVDAAPFDSAAIERLAGDYRLVFVSDSYPTPGSSREAKLHLAVNRDTLRRFYQYSVLRQAWHRWGERPLVGWLEGSLPLQEVHAVWSGDPGSRDPDAPGIYYEQGYAEFTVGRVPNLMDGAGTTMEVRWTHQDGFGGRWMPDLGLAMIVDSATGRRLVLGGTYCAWRQ